MNIDLVKAPDGLSDEQFEEWVDSQIRQGKAKDITPQDPPVTREELAQALRDALYGCKDMRFAHEILESYEKEKNGVIEISPESGQ